MTARITERFGIVSAFEPKDWEAGGDSESIKLDKYGHLALVFTFGALTGDAVLKVYSGVTAAKTTSLAFKYRLSDADYKATNNDQFGDEASAVAADGLTLTAATYDHRTLVVEVDASDITDTHIYITAELSAAASVALASAVGILTQPRYSANDMPTAVD